MIVLIVLGCVYVMAGLILLMLAIMDLDDYKSYEDATWWRVLESLFFITFIGPGYIGVSIIYVIFRDGIPACKRILSKGERL